MASAPAANGSPSNMSLEDIESQIASLQLLKSQKIQEAAPKKSKKDLKREKAGKIEVKVPKGTKGISVRSTEDLILDWFGQDMAIREKMFAIITRVFKRHGGMALDTPVFELKEVLTGKYGEDSKLIYDLQDQGGELCSLRYDLTVPFARWLAMDNLPAVKRYHLAKVYRRDQPAVQKGRMREFFQCDFDIAGEYDAMIPDAEIIRIIDEIFTELEIGAFTIKLNHRKLLDGVFEVCGVPEDKIRAISSAVDKLDKLPWKQVKVEMVETKGLAPDVADRIYEYVQLKGAQELLDKLKQDPKLAGNASAKKGLEDMTLLFAYLSSLAALKNVSFDLSLARGLDYYTGMIFEVITSASAPPPPPTTVNTTSTAHGKKKKSADPDDDVSESVGVGSICGGGRYDDLVGRFSGGARDLPCVGMSVGIERVFAILKAKHVVEMRGQETQVYLLSMGDISIESRLEIMKELWDSGIKAEFQYKKKPQHITKQFKQAERIGAPLAIILGEEELNNKTVRVKQLGLGEQSTGDEVERSKMVGFVKGLLQDLES